MRFFLLLLTGLLFFSCSEEKTSREQVIEKVNELFIFTDNRDWAKVEQVFDSKVLFDMTSLGAGSPKEMNPKEITAAWDKGLKPLKAIHHQVGNYLVSIKGNTAEVFCYVIAIHFLLNPSNQTTKTFIGSYNLRLQKKENWVIDQFKFNLKY
jgi:hypothetical protein